jgi:putative hemolysin
MPDEFFLILTLFCLSALFSGAEVAIFSLKEVTTAKLSQSQGFLARRLSGLLENKSECLIVVLVGNLLVNIFLSALATKIAMDHFGVVGLPYAIFTVTILLIFFSEITPKTIALKNATAFSLGAAPFLSLIYHTIFPIIRLLDRVSNSLLNLILGKDLKATQHLNTDELSTLVSLGEQQGVFDGLERQLIEQILEFQEVYAVEKMVPRPDIIAVELHESRESILKKVGDIKHSKIPIYKEDLDYIVGYFQVKDLVLFPEKKVSEILRPVYIIPEMKPLDKLLQEMQIQNLKLAVLVDEYGNMQGIITIEDVLETIFGDWAGKEEALDQPIYPVSESTYIVGGATTCREINTYFDRDFFSEEQESGGTLAGVILSELNKVPEVGDVLELKAFRLKVTQVLKRRILEVELSVTPQEIEKK